MASIQTEQVTFPSAQDTIGGYLARPAGRGPWPAVLIAPAVFGVNAYIRGVAHDLATAGFVALAVDVYSRIGTPTDLTTVARIMAAVDSVPDRQAVGDIRAAAAYVNRRPDVVNDAVGVIGFCMGGTLAFLTACDAPEVKAAVSFYGLLHYPQLTPNKPVRPLDRVAEVQCPLLYEIGDLDPYMPPEMLAELRRGLAAQGKVYEMVVHAGAPHSFHDHNNPNYRPIAAGTAWQQTLAFLRWYLSGEPAVLPAR